MKQAINITNVYEELKKIERTMVTKEEMNGLLETLAIMSNKGTMEQIRKSEEDIASGKTKEINSAKDL